MTKPCKDCGKPKTPNRAGRLICRPCTSTRNRAVRLKTTERQTHCIQGHEYTPENTYLCKDSRRCRECRRIRNLANSADRLRLGRKKREESNWTDWVVIYRVVHNRHPGPGRRLTHAEWVAVFDRTSDLNHEELARRAGSDIRTVERHKSKYNREKRTQDAA